MSGGYGQQRPLPGYRPPRQGWSQGWKLAVAASAGLVLGVAVLIAVASLSDSRPTYPAPDCAPGPCEDIEDQFLAVLRLELEDGEWGANSDYEHDTDSELLDRGRALCSQGLPDPSLLSGAALTNAYAVFATANDLDVALVVAAGGLCYG